MMGARTKRVHRVFSLPGLMGLLLLVLALALSGCGGGSASPQDYSDAKVLITGIGDADFSVTIQALSQLKQTSEKAESTRNNGEKVWLTATGPTLETFLAQYDKKVTDFTSVRFSSSDGYSISIPKEMLEKRQVILSVKNGRKALDEQAAPLWVVVLKERAMYWPRMVNRIDFEQGTPAVLTGKVVFLDTALPELKGEYSAEEGGDMVSTKALIEEFGGGEGDVLMVASDGLTKKETADHFEKGYLKYTGEKIPQFCSPDLPEGMNLDGVMSIRAGSVLYYSLDRAKEVLPEMTGGDKKGLAFTDIAKGNQFGSAASYVITGRDGKTATLKEEELLGGVFVKEGDVWSFWLNEKKQVKEVFTLEAGQS